jgi:hypothetical protein
VVARPTTINDTREWSFNPVITGGEVMGRCRFMSGAGPARAVLGPRVEGGSRRVHAA